MNSVIEKELQKVLNQERVENLKIYQYGIFITTHDKEIEITADNDEPIVKINKRETIVIK